MAILRITFSAALGLLFVSCDRKEGGSADQGGHRSSTSGDTSRTDDRNATQGSSTSTGIHATPAAAPAAAGSSSQ